MAGIVVGGTASTTSSSTVTTTSPGGITITSTIPVVVSSGTTTTTPTTSTTPSSTTPTTSFTPSTSVTVVTAVITSTVSGSQVVQTTQSTSSIATSAPANREGDGGLSGGAKTGVIVGSVVGGVLVLALLGIFIFCCVKRNRNSYTPGEDEIRWPQADADADQLYPAAVRETRGHGMLERGDSLRSSPNDASDYSGRSFAAVGGAGVAGMGAGAAAAYPAYAAPSTYYGQSTQDHSAYGQYADVSSAGGDPYGQAAAYSSQDQHSPRPLSGAYSMSEVSQPHMPAGAGAGAGAAGIHRNGSIAESTWRSADAYRGNLKVTNE